MESDTCTRARSAVSQEPHLVVGEPELVEREAGGWLAVSPHHATIRIGVTADTAAAALEQFQRAALRWQQLHDLAERERTLSPRA
jgi:hypothetical protein